MTKDVFQADQQQRMDTLSDYGPTDDLLQILAKKQETKVESEDGQESAGVESGDYLQAKGKFSSRRKNPKRHKSHRGSPLIQSGVKQSQNQNTSQDW